MIRGFTGLLTIALIAVMLAGPATALACGPFSLDTIFVFTVHPEYPLDNFARGDLGTIQPSYARSYLYVAYRYLNGNSFTPDEQNALVELWRDRLNLRWEPSEEQSVKRWLEARNKVAGAAAITNIEVYRSREKPNEYETYLNCQKDSFETAAATLEARTKQWGADSASVKTWVEAQDQVFANCSEGKHVPAATAADADTLVRADRQYQIAAANFYAGDFDQALAGFQTIAADRTSPWHNAAPYLIARTLLRKASLGPEDQKPQSLTESEKQLNQILASEELKQSHENAQRLLSLVRLRLHPKDVVHELATSLTGKKANPNLKQELWDYTVLMDQFIGDEPASVFPANTAALGGDELTEWIVTLQSEKPEASSHAFDRWQATSSIPWLIAALTKVNPKHPHADTLRRAAAAVPPDSPAFPSAVFHIARLNIGAGRFNEARAMLDEALRKDRAHLNASALNSLRHERMLVANNLDEFLTYAQSVPAAMSWNDDGREIPAEADDVSEGLKSLQGKPLFDDNAAKVLNEKFPLSLLKQAAVSKTLPEHLRRDVAQVAWLRSVILRDEVAAAELAPTLKGLVPEMAPLLDNFLAAPDWQAKQFAGIYAWLKFPGLEPIVDAGIGRQIPLGEQDSYRDNWWCGAAFTAPADDSEAGAKKRAANEVIAPAFLTRAQQANASKEHVLLSSLGAAPNYISEQVVAWATRNPADPRVPEALHLAVDTTRHGCTDKQTGRWSKAAYDFLHRRYPNNAWTKRTPYWFKD
jgi:tetratricopeptide (TPR) repeat protein